jgi:acyl transferase domain-containing protein
MPKHDRTGSEVAIIGMACRFPGAGNVEAFWRNITEGRESITVLSPEEMLAAGVDPRMLKHPDYVGAAAVLDGAELFDASFFGYTPREAEIMDPQQRLFLECAWEALENAGYAAAKYPGSIGVFAGGRLSTYMLSLLSDPDLMASLDPLQVGIGNDIGLLSMLVSYKLGLTGPSYFVQTACSTSLVAIHLARQSLLIGECEMALAGAVAIDVPQKKGYLHQKGGILSADGHVRAFDAGASGTLFGNGVGVVVLKQLQSALEDRDRIYAIVRGSATNNDGSAKASFTAPSVEGQAKVVLGALVDAELPADAIGYLEAHGTGTSLGDPIEVRALTKAFRATPTGRASAH